MLRCGCSGVHGAAATGMSMYVRRPAIVHRDLLCLVRCWPPRTTNVKHTIPTPYISITCTAVSSRVRGMCARPVSELQR